MPKKLDASLADAIATLVATGFILQNNAAEGLKKTTLGYEDKSDKEKHDEVTALLDGAGIEVRFSLLPSKAEQPCIFGKTPKVYTTAVLKGIVDDLGSIVDKLELEANSKHNIAPYGAYIGAKSSVSTIQFVGPSDLALYPPRIRAAPGSGDDTVKKAYDKAVQATNRALQIMRDVNGRDLKNRNVKISTATLIGDVTAPYTAGYLFKSYHGMINAMANFLSTQTSEDVFLELALGGNTKKVASCVPCSLFMSANGHPASATHFGRGDNWNIPPKTASANKSAWESMVTDCYAAGKQHFSSKKCSKYTKALNAVEYADTAGFSIPEIFLEALTFESPFLCKIKSTLE